MKIGEITLSILESIEKQLIENTIVWINYTNNLLEDVNIDVKTSQCFVKTNKKYLKNIRVQTALKNFLVAKAQNPQQPYGGKDYPMMGKGPLGGIKHAGLTNDVSVMYEIKNNVIYLFALGSHDELGFGRPNNIKKQKSLVKKINNFCKDEGL
jgi:mRNA-degrading endonuclease YafQ of YafQ-DinJ toxin-antitoxin module